MIEQRLWTNNEQDLKYFREFIRLAKKHKGACDQVWFALPHGLIKKDFLEKNIDALLPIAKELRDAGIGVSVQAGIMAKHGPGGLRSCDADSYLDLDIDGSGIGLCPRDRRFIQYQKELVALYASRLKPDVFWPDDDMGIRFVFAEPRCTCPECMKEFNSRHGYNYTRESLLSAMEEDLTVRENFLEFAYESLANVAYEMAKSAKEAYPDIHMALQHGAYNGDSIKRVFEAYKAAGDDDMYSRSGAGAYHDRDPMELVIKARQLEWQLTQLPDYVTHRCPEVENFPHVYYGKSMHGVCVESTLHLAQGFNSLSYSAIPRNQEDLSYVEDYFAALSKYRPYWDTIIEKNNGATRSGAQIYVPENHWNRKEPEWYKFCPEWSFYNWRAGLPLTYQKQTAPVYALDAKSCECLTRREVEYLAKMPVLTSAKALSILEERGFGDLLGARVKPKKNGSSRGVYFTEHEVNSTLTQISFTTSPFEGMEHFTIEGNVEPLSVYGSYNYLGDNEREYIEKDSVADAIVIMPTGAKWAVFGYAAFTEFMSFNRRVEILRAFEYIGGTLPAVIWERNHMELFPSSDSDGRVKNITLVNCSIEKANGLTVRINNPAGKSFLFMDAERRVKLDAEIFDGYANVKLPAFDGWSVGTVFVED